MGTISSSTLMPIGKLFGIVTLAIGATWGVADFKSTVTSANLSFSAQLALANVELKAIKEALTRDVVTQSDFKTYLVLLRLANTGRDIIFPPLPNVRDDAPAGG